MNATLSFNLPEEQDEFTLANKGGEFYSCLFDLDNECRSYLKHGHKFKNANEVLQWVRDMIGDVDLECVS